MRLFDGFPYNGEREILDLRMRELSGVVDGFALVQSDRNFRGEPRQPHDVGWIISKWPKVRTFLRHPPPGPHPTTDYFQRASIGEALVALGPAVGDLLMLSDVDEIPNSEVLARLKDDPPDEPVVLMQHLFYYSPQWLQAQSWAGPIVWRYTGAMGNTQSLRNERGNLRRMANGGWHLSYFGTPERIATKIRDMDHYRDACEGGEQGYVVAPDPNDTAFLADCRATGADLLRRPQPIFRKQRVALGPGGKHPHKIQQWLSDYPEYAS